MLFCAPSIHRNNDPADKKEYRYQIIGTSEPAMLNELQAKELQQHLYSICSRYNMPYQKIDNGNSKEYTDKKGTRICSNNNKHHNNLSDETIQTSVEYLKPYYKKDLRNSFALPFSGATWYVDVSEESALKILSGICDATNDDEKRSRLEVVSRTYERGYNGQPIQGGPTLVQIISQAPNCDNIDTASLVVDSVKLL